MLVDTIGVQRSGGTASYSVWIFASYLFVPLLLRLLRMRVRLFDRASLPGATSAGVFSLIAYTQSSFGRRITSPSERRRHCAKQVSFGLRYRTCLSWRIADGGILASGTVVRGVAEVISVILNDSLD